MATGFWIPRLLRLPPPVLKRRANQWRIGLSVARPRRRSRTRMELSRCDYAAAIRVKDKDGDWADVDYTLEKKSDGTYGPKAAPGDVSIGGGGSGDAASVRFADGTGVALTWPEYLSEPTISRGTATYKVSDSADLLVSVTGSGLATRIRLNEEPKADDPALILGLETTKLNIDQPSDDKLEFEKTSGKRLGTVSSMAAWDSRRDEFGDPLEVVPVEASLEKTDTAGSTVTHDMELTVPGGFLEDADTQYPVMIDPDISAVSLTQDTWVRSGTSTVDTLPYRLLVGRIASHSSDMPAQSYIQWSNTQLADKDVTAATMNLYQYAAGSCSAKSMNIHPLENAWSENSTTWYANKPNGMTATGTSTSLTEMRGGDGCAANGYVSTSIRDMAQAWANGPANGGFTNRGVQLNVPSANGTDVNYERRFCSSEPDTTASSCNTATRTPYLSVTYNTYPDVASAPVVDTVDTHVTVSSTVSDADGGAIRAKYVVTQGSTTVLSELTDFGVSGDELALDIPSLAPGSYQAQAWSDDGQVLSRQGSAVTSFTVSPETTEPPDSFDPCDFEVEVDNTALTVDGPIGGATPQELVSDDPGQSIYEGDVAGEDVRVTVWKGASAADLESDIADSEDELESLAAESVNEAVEGDHSSEDVEETVESGDVPDGDLEPIAYRLESDESVEYGTLGEDDCAQVSSEDEGDVVLGTEGGPLMIPAETAVSGASARGYPTTTSAIRYRTFIPGATATTKALCGTFRGDNRGFTGYYSARNRTRASVFFNWASQSITTSKNIGATDRLKAYGYSAKTKTASSKGIEFYYPYINSVYGRIEIGHAVGNPLCGFAGAIRYNVVVEAWRDGSARIAGKRGKVPNHEAYLYPTSGEWGKKIFTRKHASFICLSVNCGDESLWETYS